MDSNDMAKISKMMPEKTSKEPNNVKDAYTVKEVCYKLNISIATLKRRIKEGKLKTYKRNGKLMITEDELKRFIEEFPKYNPQKKGHSKNVNATTKLDDFDILNVLVEDVVTRTLTSEHEDRQPILDILKIGRWEIGTIKDLSNQRDMCKKLIRIYQRQYDALSIQIEQIREINQIESSAAELKLLHVIFDTKLSDVESDYIKLYEEYLIKRFLIREKIRLITFLCEGYHLEEDFIIDTYYKKRAIALKKEQEEMKKQEEMKMDVENTKID